MLLRVPADLMQKLDEWIERQPDPKPSRQQAIIHLVELDMEEKGELDRPLSRPDLERHAKLREGTGPRQTKSQSKEHKAEKPE